MVTQFGAELISTKKVKNVEAFKSIKVVVKKKKRGEKRHFIWDIVPFLAWTNGLSDIPL